MSEYTPPATAAPRLLGRLLSVYDYVETQRRERPEVASDTCTSIAAVARILSDAGVDAPDVLIAAFLCGNELLKYADIKWAGSTVGSGVADLLCLVGYVTTHGVVAPDAIKKRTEAISTQDRDVQYIVLAMEIDRLRFVITRENNWDAPATHDYFVLANALLANVQPAILNDDTIGQNLLEQLRTAVHSQVVVNTYATYKGLPPGNPDELLRRYMAIPSPNVDSGDDDDGAEAQYARMQAKARKLERVSRHARRLRQVVNTDPGPGAPKLWLHEPTVDFAMSVFQVIHGDPAVSARPTAPKPTARECTRVPYVLLDILDDLIVACLAAEFSLPVSLYTPHAPIIRIPEMCGKLAYAILDSRNTLTKQYRQYTATVYYALASRLDTLLTRRLRDLTASALDYCSCEQAAMVSHAAIDSRRASLERHVALYCDICMSAGIPISSKEGDDEWAGNVERGIRLVLQQRSAPFDADAYKLFTERLHQATRVDIGLGPSGEEEETGESR